MFSNAKSVEINGKEVQSIVLENGGVLYEKLGNTNLELTYSPSTVYNGDTVTLTTILTNGDISNKEISLLASEPCFDKYFPPLGLSVGEEFCIKQYQGDIVWARSNRAILEDKLMVRDTSVQYTPITYPIYIKKIDSSPTYEFYHSPNGQKTLILTDTIDNEEFTLSGSILGQSNYTNISTNSNGIASTNIICDNFSSVNITASYNDLSDNVNIIVNDKYNYEDISGAITWVGDSASSRPSSVTVHLYRDEHSIEQRIVTAGTNWNYSFGRVPMDDGYEHYYDYSIHVDGVSGYASRVDDFNITLISLHPIGDEPTPPTPGDEPTPPTPGDEPTPRTPGDEPIPPIPEDIPERT